MARLPSVLPSREDLGQMPSGRTGRNIARIDIDAYGAPGRGMAAIGQGLASLGGSLQAAQDEQENQDVQRRLLEMEQQQQRQLDESQRTLTGDPSGFSDRFRSDFTDAGRGAFASAREAGLSDRALRRLDMGLYALRENLHTRAFHQELNQRGNYGQEWTAGQLGKLSQDYMTAPDDAARERILADAQRTVTLGRQSYGFPFAVEQHLRKSIEGMVEQDALSRSDGYSALLELREGDQRVRQPSTGEISELGLSRLEQSVRQPGMTPPQIREAQGRLRSETGALSKFVQDNLQEGVGLTQAQHDALVSYGVVRGKDALQELMPLVNSEGPDRDKALAQAMRTKGGLTTLEQPSGAEMPSGGGVEVRPVPGGRSPIGASPRPAGIEGVVIHHTSGSTLQGALSANGESGRQRGTGANYYVDRDGSLYQFVPDNQMIAHIRGPGDRTRTPGAWPNLSNANTIGIEMVARSDADVTDAQRETLRRFLPQLQSQYGFDRQNVVGHGDIQGGPRGNKEANEGVAAAREFREGQQGPTRLAQRGGTMTDAGTAAPSGDRRIDEYSGLMEGQAPSSRYSSLPIDRRRVLIGKLEEALRHDLMRDMEDDLENIRQTGRPTVLPDGSTSFTRASRVLTRNQLSRYQYKYEEAVTEYRALHGLQDMTAEQIRQRSDELSRAASNPQSGERMSIITRTRNMFDTAASRMSEEGTKDSAQSVEGGISLPRVGTRRRETIGLDGQPVVSGEIDIDHRLAPAREVAEAHDAVRRRYASTGYLQIGTDENGNVTINRLVDGDAARQAEQDAWRIIMDARMAAATRRGTPERYRSPITKGEAASLLNLPRNRVTDTTEFSNLMRAAVDRAYERYGPYARQALNAAIAFRSNLSNDQADIARSALQKMVEGVGVDAGEIGRLTRSLQLDREQAAWLGRPSYMMPGELDETARPMGGVYPHPVAPPPPTIWQRMTGGGGQQPAAAVPAIPQGQMTPSALQIRPGPQSGYPKPTTQDVSDLQRYPDLQPIFDRLFGPGAAMRSLQGAGR